MKLEKIAYSEYLGGDKEWILDTSTFEEINLVVGKNATGKSRALQIIRSLATLLSESEIVNMGEGNFKAEFKIDNKAYDYSLEYHQNNVKSEELLVDGQQYLTRGKDGTGSIYYVAKDINRHINFKTENDRIAALGKRDAIQTPYLVNLYDWAKGVTKYDFGTTLGKEHLILMDSDIREQSPEIQISIKDTQGVVGIFLQGIKEFPNEYKQAILRDMNILGYKIEEVGADVVSGVSIVMPRGISGRPTGIYVNESDLTGRTEQALMSQGMFRALSVLVQINYGVLSKQSTCLLIDDIGEGLDFSRSSALVKLLIDKVKGSSIQLIMSTNDRFIMNAVPLEYWIILIRNGGRVASLNYKDSKAMFDEFQNTGLSNFDLFSSGYYKQAS